jgi:hypothetical protein
MERFISLSRCKRMWYAARGCEANCAVLMKKQDAKFGFANANCFLQDGCKYGLKIAGGTADDLKHLRCGPLLLKGFAQFVEQPRVLDCDDCLGGEVLHQGDLLIGEWANFSAVDVDYADQSALLQDWDAEYGPTSPEVHGLNGKGIMLDIRFCLPDVGNVNNVLGGLTANASRRFLARFSLLWTGELTSGQPYIATVAHQLVWLRTVTTERHVPQRPKLH